MSEKQSIWAQEELDRLAERYSAKVKEGNGGDLIDEVLNAAEFAELLEKARQGAYLEKVAEQARQIGGLGTIGNAWIVNLGFNRFDPDEYPELAQWLREHTQEADR